MPSVEELVVQIRERINYEEVFGEFLRMRGRGPERKAFCVFHENTDSEAMSVNVVHGLFKCHNPVCDAHGDIFDFYRRVRSLTFTEALHELAARVGIHASESGVHPAAYHIGGRTARDGATDALDSELVLAAFVQRGAAVQNGGESSNGTHVAGASHSSGGAGPRPSRRQDASSGREEERTERRVIDPIIATTFHDRLVATPAHLEYLETRRGLTRETIETYSLGHDGQRYTIPVRDTDGAIVNIRRYDPDARQAHEKMVSWRTGYGEARLYPLERWQEQGAVYLVEGEWDCLVARQNGLDAYTVTTGAGTWRDVFTPLFRGRDVVVCYDVDDAGRRGAANVARELHGTARSIKVVTLPLAADGADISDYFVQHGHTRDDFLTIVAQTAIYTPSLNDAIPLAEQEPISLHLSQASESQYYNKPIRVNVMVSGKTMAPYLVPREIQMSCRMPGLKMCETCPVARNAGTLNHKIEFDTNELLQFINVTDATLRKQIKAKVRVPSKCNYVQQKVLDAMNVEVVQMIPEVERGSEAAHDYVTRESFFIGHGLKANQSYIMNGVTVPEPRRQLATHLIYEAVPAQSNIDAFSLTPAVVDRLRLFQPRADEPGVGGLWAQLERIYGDLERVTRIYQRRDLMLAVDLTYHSLIGFTFQGERLRRGWVECLMIGDSRTGKSSIVERLQTHYGAGEFTTGENTSFAGLVGGLHQVGTSWALQWGKIPLNDRRLLVIDEAGNLSQEHIGRMSSMRTSGEAMIVKIHTEKTNARTRQIWISNPRGNKPLSMYGQGVLAVKEMIGAPEDIARFDIILTAASADVPLGVVNLARIQESPTTFTNDLCHQRVMWAWSRTSDNVVWAPGTAEKVLEIAMRHGEEYRYGTEIPLVEPNEQRIKLARLAVSTAAMFFSTDEDGEVVIVRPEHVEFVGQFLDTIYNKPSLAFTEYASNMRRKYELTDSDRIHRIISANSGSIRAMLEQESFTMRDLQEILGIDDRTQLREVSWALRDIGFLRKNLNNNYVKTPAAIRWLREQMQQTNGRVSDGDGFENLRQQRPPTHNGRGSPVERDDDGSDPAW